MVSLTITCWYNILLIHRLYLDVLLFYNGLGSIQLLLTLEFYLLASFLLVYPAFKVSEVFSIHSLIGLRFSALGNTVQQARI